MPHDTSGKDVILSKVEIGILKKYFPCTYLGCTIFNKRNQKSYYNQMIHRINSKLHAWREKLLSYGRRAILIKLVLQSIYKHYLSVMNPPQNMLNQIQ